jgi:hypothetical protein
VAFIDMISELANAIPAMSRQYARTLANRSYRHVQDSSLWSFQLQTTSWATPALINSGVVTPSLGSTTVTGDATAVAAWNTAGFPFLTQRQFRIGNLSIYNIIDFDSGAGTITLDRPFTDPLPTPPQGYQILQQLIPAPTKEFKRWLSVSDMYNNRPVFIHKTKREIDLIDPTRQMTSNPSEIFSVGQNVTPTSAKGYQMYEMWPTPLANLPYQGFFVTRAPALSANSDTLPEPLSEELILAKSREYMYEWAEARKDIMAAKGSQANYLLLKSAARKDYEERLKQTRILDKENVNVFMARIPNYEVLGSRMPFYNSLTGRANPGW